MWETVKLVNSTTHSNAVQHSMVHKQGLIQHCNSQGSQHQEGHKVAATFSMISIIYTINRPWISVLFLLRSQKNWYLLIAECSHTLEWELVEAALPSFWWDGTAQPEETRQSPQLCSGQQLSPDMGSLLVCSFLQSLFLGCGGLWQRPSIKLDHGDIALHLSSSPCSPVTCWSKASTMAHLIQFLFMLSCLPQLMMFGHLALVIIIWRPLAINF